MAYLKADNVKMEGTPKEMAEAHEHLCGSKTYDEKENCSMNDIAGLLALMQGNKGMDLPGLLALCKEKGYDRAWGGEGMFMFVFLILFLFAGGGWGNLNRGTQDQFAHMAGQNLQDIIGLYDRLSANQTATQQGFQALDTKLCSSIAETITAVRNQGDRAYDATRNVGDAVRDCCCTMQRLIAELGCKVDGLYGHTSLLQERTVNVVNQRFCELENQLKDLQAQTALGFERQACLITNTATQTEMARKDREIENLKDTLRSTEIANRAVEQLKGFAVAHYTPTRTGANAPA